MARGKAFVEVLDEVLAGFEPAEPIRPPCAGPGYATPSILFFDAGFLRGGPESPAFVPPMSTWAPAAERRSTAPRLRRALAPQEREALAAFVQLGADISDDFTHAELRSVFRSLALRYHPDRHPGSSDGEKARLSVSFAQLHQAYETLKSTPASSH